MTKLSLKMAWNLWEKAEKGWENGKPEGDKLEGQKPKEEKSYKKPEVVMLQPKTPSGFNALEAERKFVPGNDKDAKVMQLETEIAKLEEALMELELSEAFITPDSGTSVLGRSLFSGAALEPSNGYDRNFCPDPPAPEEGSNAQDQDASATLIAPREFIPKEELSKLMEAIEWNRKTRLAKLF